jgi:type IV pilus assembly protein PilC
MKKYVYRARDKSGNLVTGDVEASNESAAAKLLRDRGYIVVSIRPSMNSLKYLMSSFSNRVSYSDVVAFTRQLATMVNAGLPITESFSILRLQAKPSFQPIIQQILADIEGGQSLSNAIKRHPRVFTPSYIALVRAGETGGVLDKVLARLADNMERTQEFRGKVKGALIYPMIIVIGMIGVSIVMIVFVIPKLTTLYSQFGAELPLSTKILTGISDFIIQFWYLIVVGLGIAGWGYYMWSKTDFGKHKMAEIMFKLPIIGDLQKQIILTELTRTLSLMVASGVPILEGLAVSSDVVTNVIISDAIKDVSHQIEKGFPIAFSFAKHPDAFPYILSQMVAVGEETGKMDEVLSKISHVFEVESEQKVKALTSAIEPIIMIFLGLGVAFLVIAVVLPIYKLTTSI